MFANILINKPHNTHHLFRYIRFIESCQLKQQTEDNLEIHHICPKSADLFPEFSSLVDYPWNGIRLTLRQHYIAHRMLWKAFGGKQAQAFKLMSERCQRTSSKCYEEVRLEHAMYMSKNNPNYDGKFSKKCWENATPERRKRQSDIMKQVNARKKKPRIVREYNCTNCGAKLEREEFVHKSPNPNYYCNASCRAKFVATYRKSIVGIKYPNRVAHNKGKPGTGFGSGNNPMHNPILVQKMLESRSRNKKAREIGLQGLPQTPESD